jgi:hypothetical protein
MMLVYWVIFLIGFGSFEAYAVAAPWLKLVTTFSTCFAFFNLESFGITSKDFILMKYGSTLSEIRHSRRIKMLLYGHFYYASYGEMDPQKQSFTRVSEENFEENSLRHMKIYYLAPNNFFSTIAYVTNPFILQSL